MAHSDAREGEVKGKLANGVGSQYSSHNLGTWCIQHYYRWCAHLGCQWSTEMETLCVYGVCLPYAYLQIVVACGKMWKLAQRKARCVFRPWNRFYYHDRIFFKENAQCTSEHLLYDHDDNENWFVNNKNTKRIFAHSGRHENSTSVTTIVVTNCDGQCDRPFALLYMFLK